MLDALGQFLTRLVYRVRYWLIRRQLTTEEYKPKALLAVDCGDSDVVEEEWFRAALAFVPTHAEIKILEAEEVPPPNGLNANIEYLRELAPSHYLFLGREAPSDTAAALQFLGVPYQVLSELEPPSEKSNFPLEDTKRQGLNEMVGRRYAIYTHCTSKTSISELREFFQACREARLNFPDLLILISGTNMKKLSACGNDLRIATRESSKPLRSSADVIFSEEKDILKDWVSVGNVAVILPSNKGIDAYSRLVLSTGSALIAYGVDLQGRGELAELDASGAIWSVQRKGLLGAAISQALLPEKSALTAIQSLDRLTQIPTELDKVIDNLLSRKGEWNESA